MIRQLFILVFLALTALGCDRSGESSSPPQTTAPVVDPNPVPPAPEVELVVDRLLMWEVSAPGSSDATSHLVGTYHIGTDFHGLGELPEPGRLAFEAARVVVLEADQGVVDPALDKLMVIDGPRTLDTMLTPEQWEVALEHTGLPPQQLKRLQPFGVVGELARKWTPDAGVRGMDGRLRILAKAYDKKLRFLEQPREQLELLADALTLEMLAETLDHAEQEQERSVKLLATFKSGDPKALEAQLFNPTQVEAHRDFYDKVFWRRNNAWLEPLKPLLDEGGAFVAVGAGHLLGEPNLRTVLQEAGYSVRAVEP